jgi:tetratricopeptide (TPR) repeat protein
LVRASRTRLAASLLVVSLAGGCAWLSFAETPASLSREGRELYLAGRYDEAIEKLERAVELGGAPGSTYLHLARCYMAQENWTLAIANARLAAEALPNGEAVEDTLSEALRGGGAAAVHAGQFTLAISEFTEYVSRHPNDARGFLRLGQADLSAGRYANALGAFTRGIENDRIGVVKQDLLRGLLDGGTHALRHGRAKEAIPLLQEYVHVDPTNPAAYVVLARALLETGDGPHAREALDRALLLDPRQPDATALRGQLR